MIFEDRYRQCQKCHLNHLCKYKEIYYKNKGEWPVVGMCMEFNGKNVCKEAFNQGLVG